MITSFGGEMYWGDQRKGERFREKKSKELQTQPLLEWKIHKICNPAQNCQPATSFISVANKPRRAS